MKWVSHQEQIASGSSKLTHTQKHKQEKQNSQSIFMITEKLGDFIGAETEKSLYKYLLSFIYTYFNFFTLKRSTGMSIEIRKKKQ